MTYFPAFGKIYFEYYYLFQTIKIWVHVSHYCFLKGIIKVSILSRFYLKAIYDCSITTFTHHRAMSDCGLSRKLLHYVLAKRLVKRLPREPKLCAISKGG